MSFGAVMCPADAASAHHRKLREIKAHHNARGELKWTKVSGAREAFYLDVVEYFIGASDLTFRALVVQNKEFLDHDYFNQGSHDSFYYKMYYYLLRNMLHAGREHRVFLDLKDTRSQEMRAALHEYLCNTFYDWEKELLEDVQHVRSHEVELVQLADFLLGAVSFSARGLPLVPDSSPAKKAVVAQLESRIGASLSAGTPPWEEKLNLFYFEPRRVNGRE
jgi:hypothetical protein